MTIIWNADDGERRIGGSTKGQRWPAASQLLHEWVTYHKVEFTAPQRAEAEEIVAEGDGERAWEFLKSHPDTEVIEEDEE